MKGISCNLKVIQMLFLLFAFQMLGVAQKDSNNEIETYDSTTKHILTRTYWDTETGDTTVRDYRNCSFIRKNKLGITVFEGKLTGGECFGCGSISSKDGFWIFRHNNGNIDSMGKFKCEILTGVWTYCYPSGTIKKICTYTDPDDGKTHFFNLYTDDYVEFYENGRTKMIGKYKIGNGIDSFHNFDHKTQKWGFRHENVLVSVKSGEWKFYDINGILTKTEIFEK